MVAGALAFVGIFRRHVVRDVRRHPLLALLNIAAIALGSAVYLAVQTANQTAISAFEASVDLVSGKAHLEVQGAGQPLPDALWPVFRDAPEISAATPLVEGIATLPELPGDYLKITGVDLFTNAPFSTFSLRSRAEGPPVDVERFLSTDRAVALSQAFAADHGIQVGDRLAIAVDGHPHALVVTGLIRPEEAPPGTDRHLAVMDIGWAQEILGKTGALTRIQLRLPEPTRAGAVAEALLTRLSGSGVRIETPASRTAQVQNLLMGFQLNLTALSLISLLVGAFLVFNTVSASVVRRRHELGILRAIGASRMQVRALFLGEALLYGILGLLGGVGLGLALAQGLLGRVTQTIRNLYVLVEVETITPSATALIATVGVSLLAVLVGAWKPADEAARMPVLAALGGRSALVIRRNPRQLLWLALGGLGAAGISAWVALATPFSSASFASAFFVLTSVALLSAHTTLATARGARWLGNGLPTGAATRVLIRLGADHLQRALHRNAATVAALMASIAMMIGVTTMIHAFRSSVTSWIDGTMRADLFFSSAANEIGGSPVFLPEALVESIRALPGVAQLDPYREWETAIDGIPGMVALVRRDNRQVVEIVRGNPEVARAAFQKGEGVLVTESFARKRGRNPGDLLVFQVGPEQILLPIVGVYRDYTRDQGMVLFPADRHAAATGESRVQSVAIHLEPEADFEEIAATIRRLFPEAGRYRLYTRDTLRERVIEIFDQTFAVTYLLRTIAVGVAAMGVILTLSILVIERRREFGILRSMGMSQGQMIGMTVVEGVGIGLAAAGLGVVAGLLLAGVLTFVVNVAFFGWTIQFRVPWPELFFAPAWVVATAAAAACWPAWRATRDRITEAVRAE